MKRKWFYKLFSKNSSSFNRLQEIAETNDIAKINSISINIVHPII